MNNLEFSHFEHNYEYDIEYVVYKSDTMTFVRDTNPPVHNKQFDVESLEDSYLYRIGVKNE
jgi:hypothetical protein